MKGFAMIKFAFGLIFLTMYFLAINSFYFDKTIQSIMYLAGVMLIITFIYVLAREG